ncbi:unnamed protein product [Oikopleura dioica]|uniref:Uncharacterized protein n=1 Tax=Oikopleura dioica TaxID=34765 RepID=E4X2F0_OIKDI|nr:unnamed protein product [Oikopleura dioica]
MKIDEWIRKEWEIFDRKIKTRRKKKMDVVLVNQFLEEAKLIQPAKPYAWGKIQSRIIQIAEEELDKTFTRGGLQALKTFIDRKARQQAEDELYEPRPPPYFGWDDMKKIWTQLWYPPKTTLESRHKATCVSYIAYATGARTNEICNIRIEDLERTNEEGVTFLRMPLRVSKTNTRKTARESIVLAITHSEMFPILNWIDKAIGTRKEGYVINSSKSGAKEEDIVNVCRWKDATMLRYYRNHFLETTKHGSAYKIAIENEKLRNQEKEEENLTMERGTQTEEREKEKITKTQSVLRIIKIMKDGDTQTDEEKMEITEIKREEDLEVNDQIEEKENKIIAEIKVNDQAEETESIFEKFCRADKQANL